LIEAKKIFY